MIKRWQMLLVALAIVVPLLAPASALADCVDINAEPLLRTPEVIVGTWRSARPEIGSLSEAEFSSLDDQFGPNGSRFNFL